MIVQIADIRKLVTFGKSSYKKVECVSIGRAISAQLLFVDLSLS